MAGLTRGPLPAAVYWRRRLGILVVVGLVGFAVFRVAGPFGGDPDATADAELASGEPTSAAPTGAGTPKVTPPARPSSTPENSQSASDEPSPSSTDRPSQAATGKPSQGETSQGQPQGQVTDVPVMPSGPCSGGEVLITPRVPEPVAGRPVRIVLELRTERVPACTFALSPDSVTLKITSGSDLVWTSLHCPGALPERNVVVRQDETTLVPMLWGSRRSDQECSNRTEWALPGYYHVLAAALGGEPTDTQFRLRAPA